MIATLFTVLITVQFLVMVLHDWVNVPGWTHGRQMYAVLGPVKMWIGTAINAVFPGLATFMRFTFGIDGSRSTFWFIGWSIVRLR